MQIRRFDHHLFRKLFKRWFSRKYIDAMESDRSLSISDSSPIIVVGMHRSGTSLLIKAMDQMGVFTGDVTGPDTSESLLFQYLNDAILSCCQAHWSTPEPLESAISNTDWFDSVASLVSLTLESKWQHFYKIRSPSSMFSESHSMVWGWKDPRNCLTVDFWHRLYPNARFLYIYRHGMDVAESLVRREKKKGKSVYIAKCLELKGAFSMWESYNRSALKSLQSVSKSNQLHLGFEDLARNPDVFLKSVANFCELDIKPSFIAEIAAEFDSSKAYAHKTTEGSFGASRGERDLLLQSELLEKLGYS